MFRSTRVLMVVALGVLIGLLLGSCIGQTTATVTIPTQAPAPTTAPALPTAAATTAATAAATSAATQAAQPTPTAVPFTATIRGFGINPHMKINVPRVDDPTKVAALMTNGLNVVPPGVPAYFKAGAVSLAQGAKMATFAWSLKGPDGSTAQVAEVTGDQAQITGAGTASFTPDKTGTYVLTLTVTDDKGSTSQPANLNVEVARYIGANACKQCHADQFTNWSATGHASFFTRMVNEDPEGEYKTAGFGCARCHTVGYYNITKESTGGWWDVAVNVLKFQWPTDKIGQPGTYESFPAELQNVSNIQCENCHGPGGDHNGDPAKIATSMWPSQCDQCHNDGHFHIKGEQLSNSVHNENANLGFAAAESDCARCHSPEGFVDFVAGKTGEQIRRVAGPIACATCHDPHKTTFPSQVRVSGDVTGAPIPIKDQGQSALCETCHNGRTTPDTVVAGQVSFPHYSAAAEIINQAGGFDFGATIPNSPHMTLGGQPAEGQTVKPGPCVYCHMFETPGGNRNAAEVQGTEVPVTEETNPGHNLVGAHTFNMVAKGANGQTVENVAACQQCHSGITSFDFPAKADYDGNGKTEGVETEVKGLLDLVQKALSDKGVKFVEGYPYFTMPDNASTEIKGAAYNWRFVMGVIPTGQGRAAAIHNFQRTVALLQISYNKLTGQDIPNATILYK